MVRIFIFSLLMFLNSCKERLPRSHSAKALETQTTLKNKNNQDKLTSIEKSERSRSDQRKVALKFVFEPGLNLTKKFRFSVEPPPQSPRGLAGVDSPSGVGKNLDGVDSRISSDFEADGIVPRRNIEVGKLKKPEPLEFNQNRFDAFNTEPIAKATALRKNFSDLSDYDGVDTLHSFSELEKLDWNDSVYIKINSEMPIEAIGIPKEGFTYSIYDLDGGNQVVRVTKKPEMRPARAEKPNKPDKVLDLNPEAVRGHDVRFERGKMIVNPNGKDGVPRQLDDSAFDGGANWKFVAFETDDGIVMRAGNKAAYAKGADGKSLHHPSLAQRQEVQVAGVFERVEVEGDYERRLLVDSGNYNFDKFSAHPQQVSFLSDMLTSKRIRHEVKDLEVVELDKSGGVVKRATVPGIVLAK